VPRDLLTEIERLRRPAAGWPKDNAVPQTDQFRALVLDFPGQEIQKLQETDGMRAGVHVRGGEVGRVVHRVALDLKADLVLIGRGVLQDFFGCLLTNAYAIVHELPCPS